MQKSSIALFLAATSALAISCAENTNVKAAENDLGGLKEWNTDMPLDADFILDARAQELADEAKESGLVSDVYNSREEMVNAAKEMANEIAKKSPIAIYGLKALMNYSRDHTISDSLDFNALWSGAMLSQRDMEEAIKAFVEKREATFGKMADVKNFDEADN